MSKQTTAPLVYIAILNWNGYANTIACLESLSHLDYPNYHIVVVDNASTDDSVDRIRRALPDVDILCADSNLGYAGGNRLALDHALQSNAELFWILNNDAIVKPDTLARLIDAYRQCGVALYGSVPVVEADGWRVALHTQAIDAPPITLNSLYDERFAGKRPLRVDKLSGASLLIPTALIAQHGFIDLTFFMYSEEADYSLRLARQGIDTILVPASIVLHHHRGAHKHNAQLKPVITYYQVRNRLILIRRYKSILAFAFSVIKHLLIALGGVVLVFTRGRGALQLAYHVWLGTRDALLNRMGKTLAPEDYL